jgi:predicted house-cleaning noncanonical NTP pyrophosphatase (MazG superfamily)
MVSRWLMGSYKETIKHQNEKPSHIELLIADATRSWEKTFSDKLWVELARLTRFEGDPFKSRPSYWGQLVRDLIYISLDSQLYDTLKEKKANTNAKLHQGLTKEIGVRVLQSHIDEIVGIAKVCDNVIELRNVVKERYAKKPAQTNLKLYLA